MRTAILSLLLTACAGPCERADALIRAKHDACSIPTEALPRTSCNSEDATVASCEADCNETASCDALDGTNAAASIEYASCLGLCSPQEPTT